MKKKTILYTSMAVLLFCYQAKADTVGEMLMYCEKPDGDFFRGYCHQYIAGVIDVQATYGLRTNNETMYTCFPEGITSRQGASIFVKWAKSNPELHHLHAHNGVVASLYKAFSCSSE